MAGVRFPKSLTPRLASRGDGASDRRWYHGTSHEFSPGDLVTAGHPSNYEGGPQEPPGSWTDDHTYFTSEFDGAQRHARNSAFVKGGEAHVYQVEPTGPYEPTPADKDSYPRPAYNYWSEHPLRVVRRVSPGEAESQRTASRWQPSAGIFGPTTGLDPLLFGEDGTLRPQVRHDIMTRLDQCLRVDSGLAGSDWQEWLHVYIAGGSASEWAGSRPNETAQDLDVITAIDLPRAQGHSAFEGMNGGEAASALNAAFWKHFNAEGWKPESGGTWNLTAFCNQRAQDGIAAIRPYAAWDLTDMRWAVKPPHLPEHSLANFDPAVIAHARAVAAEARAVLRMPEPLRTREARDLWEHVHAHRCVAFSGEGTGWDDPGNVDEKYLAYAPHGLLGKIRDLAMAGQWRTAAIRQPEPEEFAHEVYKGDTTDLRLHGDKYILHRAGPRHINAYARGRELVQPDSPNYTKGHAQPRPVGYLSWTHHPDGKPPEIYKTMVKEKHRRKGVASAMLEFAREIEPNLQHSIMLSEDARKWVKGTEAKTGKTAASHHDTSGSDHSGVYLRFGDWPHDERSFSPAGGYHEDGVSAYDLDREGDPAIGDGLDRWHDHDEHCEPDCDLDLDNADNDPHEEMRGRVRKAERNRDYGNDKPSEAGHLVRGEMAGIGYDGEPLLKNVRRVGDWIDHRHLFIDTAGPHRLARDPSGPDYEEPEEEPPYGYRNRTAAAITSTAAAASDAHGMREKWSPGDRPHFEYHCEESHDSADAPLWYRSHQQARVLGREQDEDYPGAMEDRLEAGMPHVYRVRFDDGHEGSATEDELLTHPRYFQRPDPPQPPRTAAGNGGGEAGGPRWGMMPAGDVLRLPSADSPHAVGDYPEHRTAALAQNPPCRYCGEPLDDEDVRDGHSAHEECSDMRWCESHQDYHDDPAEAESHNDTYTEWGSYLPFEGGMHRGVTVRLPGRVHQAVHDASLPQAERARVLKGHLDEGGHYGVHWTDHLPIAQAWGSGEGAVFSGVDPKNPEHTHVVIHAASPAEEHIEDDPEKLAGRNMWGFGHQYSEREIPLREDAPVHVTGISWKRGGETEWSRHDFGEVMPHMPAKYVHVNKESRTAALDYEDDYEGDYEDDYKGNPDRYVTCGQGHEHWGALGAAGLLVRHRDGGSGPYRYLLQKRSPYVQHGRTWSTPGGALQHGESPEEGAVREAREEGMHLPPGLSHHHTFTDDHGGWAYHTVVMDSPHRFNPEGEGESDWESEGHRWVTPQEAQKLPLHPGFSASWEKVRKSGAVQKTAAPGYLRNPYHGSPEFGGRDDWSHTWFHGTKGTPDFGTRRKFSDEAQRAELPPEQRKMNSGWTQPNQHLGIHFSPLHEVAHKFVGSVSSSPGALVHARLRFSNPAVFPSEEHLNIAMADWGSKHYLHWHDDKLNGQMGWSYGDQEGTRRDYSQVPDNPRERWHLSQKAQSILQWHPHMPEILNGFRRHLADQGHHGIVYGNSLEGPYETDAGRGGDASVKYIRKRENWPAGHPYSFSAIADPGDIEVTHVEHISPWRAEPEAHQRTWEDASDQDEPDEMRDRVLGWHREHGGKLPPKLAAAPQGRDEQLAGMDPHTRATALAQEQVRYHHPRLTTPLGIRSGQTSEVLSSWLREHGHPRADEAYVAEHPSPGGMQSNTGRGPDGEPAVILHPDRWDYGTLAHEAAHLVTDHQTGRQFGAPHGPEGAHGPEWAKNYANLLGRISKPAAGHFMSLYRQHAPAPERRPDPRFTPRREDAPAPGMAYLSVPHGTLHALPPEMQSRQDGGRHHVTVAHLPRGMNDDEYEEVLRHARKAAAASPPLEGTLGGMETFPHGAGPESRRVAYVPASIPGVERLHGDLGGVNASPHPEFRPHVTVSYLRKGQDNPPPHPQVPVRFTHLHVERDGQVTSIPLTGTQRMEREAAASGPWYHGSPYRIDSSEMIEPGHDPVNADDGPLPHVYFSGSPHDAARWAEEGSRYVNEEDSPGWRTYPHVYEVRPTGHHEEDPQGEFEGDRRSLHPLQVIRERHDLGLSHDSGCPGCSAARSTRHEAVSGYDGLTDRSGMIYLDLPPGAVRPVPGGTDDHHITVVYLGKDVSDEAFAEACRRTRGAAARLAPMDGVLRGIDIFPPSASSDGKVPAFVPAYIGGIGALRRELEDLSASEHRDYRPHVTLAFMQEGDSLPAPHPAVPLHFDRVHVKRGGEVRSFPLGQTTETGRQAVAAQERPTFYHGSGKRYPDGHVIDPAEPHKKLYPQSDPGKAYFSDNLWNARNWADTASPGGKGHVYEVEPAGPYEEDPHYAGPEENGIYDLSVSPIRRINVYQTGHPLRIVRRVPPSE